MTTLIFLLTVLALIVLFIGLITSAVRHKSLKPKLKVTGLIITVYAVTWLIFRLMSKQIAIPLGTDVCFDDWCATITSMENDRATQKLFESMHADSIWIILNIKMSNHARGIAQKPSYPRVHILDEHNNYWPYSNNGQNLFARISGGQPGIDHKLELQQSLETKLVFAVPKYQKGLKILIEEGPFITKLLFPEDQMIFIIPQMPF